jgi:hypothetical protein
VALDALDAYGMEAEPAIPALTALLMNTDDSIRRRAVEILARFVSVNQEVAREIRSALDDDDRFVRDEALAALLSNGTPEQLGTGPVLHAVLSESIEEHLTPFLRQITRREGFVDDRRFRTIVLTSANVGSVSSGSEAGDRSPLPQFPWPPPKWTHIAEFGDEFPRNLLGDDESNLGQVYDRLNKSLQRIDSRFEAGLFSVPDGFALLAKLERTAQDGTPLGDDRRWIYGELPPLSLKDYISRLFFDKPGYFRILAFVVTSKENFEPGDERLPPIREGGRALPSELRGKSFAGRTCHVLVYSFERRRGGVPHHFSRHSATIHLDRAGVLGVLSVIRAEQ